MFTGTSWIFHQQNLGLSSWPQIIGLHADVFLWDCQWLIDDMFTRLSSCSVFGSHFVWVLSSCIWWCRSSSFSPFFVAGHFPALNLTHLGIYSGCLGKVSFCKRPPPQGSVLLATRPRWGQSFTRTVCHDAQLYLSCPPGVPSVSDKISNCFPNISAWMQHHHLALNLGKGQLLMFLNNQSVQHNIDVKIGTSPLAPAEVVCSLGGSSSSCSLSLMVLSLNIRKIRPSHQSTGTSGVLPHGLFQCPSKGCADVYGEATSDGPECSRASGLQLKLDSKQAFGIITGQNSLEEQFLMPYLH